MTELILDPSQQQVFEKTADRKTKQMLSVMRIDVRSVGDVTKQVGVAAHLIHKVERRAAIMALRETLDHQGEFTDEMRQFIVARYGSG